MVVAVLGVAGLAMAEGGNIARVTYWTLAPGSDAQFEEGIKAHNALHARNNDPVGIFTGYIVSGKLQGQVVRGSLGHAWADFDAEASGGAEDAADMAQHVNPHIVGARTVYYEHLPGLSRSRPGPAPLVRVIYFHLKPAGVDDFVDGVGKVHAALSEVEDWPAYDWYMIADGGPQPTMVVVLPRDNWAGFERREIEPVLVAKYGEEAKAIWEAIGGAIDSQYSHTIEFPADLAYVPSGE